VYIYRKPQPCVSYQNIPANIGVASVDGGTIFDSPISGPLRHGPFEIIQDFHRHLRMGMEFDPTFDSEVQDMMKQQDNNTWPLKFTHGDLSSFNILVRDDTVVGIIDWEYTTACQVNPQNSFWINEIDKFLQPMPTELAMEQIRQRRF
jgi:hypothetical protein